MSAFFTSDNHFSHTAIVGYCERPFRDVEEMNEEMVRRWNEVVRPTDHVYHLGDFALGPSGTAAPLAGAPERGHRAPAGEPRPVPEAHAGGRLRGRPA